MPQPIEINVAGQSKSISRFQKQKSYFRNHAACLEIMSQGSPWYSKNINRKSQKKRHPYEGSKQEMGLCLLYLPGIMLGECVSCSETAGYSRSNCAEMG